MDNDSEVLIFALVLILIIFGFGYLLGTENGKERAKTEFCKVLYKNTKDYINMMDKPMPVIIKDLSNRKDK